MESVQDFSECETCTEMQKEILEISLCPKCKRQILPQLKQPGWARLVKADHFTEGQETLPDAPTAKAIRRNQKRYSRLKNAEDGLTCHFCVESCGTPVNAYGLVCGPCGEEVRSRRGNTRGRVHYTGLRSRVA